MISYYIWMTSWIKRNYNLLQPPPLDTRVNQCPIPVVKKRILFLSLEIRHSKITWGSFGRLPPVSEEDRILQQRLTLDCACIFFCFCFSYSPTSHIFHLEMQTPSSDVGYFCKKATAFWWSLLLHKREMKWSARIPEMFMT